MTKINVTLSDAEARKVLKELERGRKRIQKGWAQKHLAYARYMTPVTPSSKYAIMWCAVGGLMNRTMSYEPKSLYLLEHFIPRQWQLKNPHSNLVAYNDAKGRTQKQVLAVYDAAIKWLKRTHGKSLAK